MREPVTIKMLAIGETAPEDGVFGGFLPAPDGRALFVVPPKRHEKPLPPYWLDVRSQIEMSAGDLDADITHCNRMAASLRDEANTWRNRAIELELLRAERSLVLDFLSQGDSEKANHDQGKSDSETGKAGV